MSYKIEDAGSFLRVALSGTVTPAELVAVATELDALARVRLVWPDHLADFRAVDTRSGSAPGMVSLLKQRVSVSFPNPVRSAIVATAPVSIGLARMFQSYSQGPQLAIGVFSTVRAAETWLATPGAPDPAASADRPLPPR